jgi:hypothetical protein
LRLMMGRKGNARRHGPLGYGSILKRSGGDLKNG